MKLRSIDQGHLLVILNRQEAEEFGLDGMQGWGSPSCRKAMARLFAIVSKGTGMEHPKRGQITIRAVQSGDGRLILLFSALFPTVGRLMSGRERFRIKKQPGPYLYFFPEAESMMSALEQISRRKLSGNVQLIQTVQGYWLIVPFSLRYAAGEILTEYGKFYGKGAGMAAHAIEYGTILSKDAVRELGAKLVRKPAGLD